VPRSEIEKMIPIPMGGVYHRSDAPFWTEASDLVKSTFDFASVDCGDRPLRVFDGRKAFLIVDIVEKGREDLLKFREVPSGSVAFASDEMVALNDELASKSMAAAMAGHGYNERGEKGCLHYDNPSGKNEDLGPSVKRLMQLVPQHLDNIFDVLQHDKDPKRRQKAATLLNWAGGDVDRTMRRALPLLDDPDFTVRNALSRWMIPFVGEVKAKRLRHQMILAFVDEIGRPSALDRNKGLYNLLEIAKTRPDDRGYIRSCGTGTIRYLAENSIIFNVKGPAEELLALLDPAAKPETAGSPRG
jgi:hypothetical protein